MFYLQAVTIPDLDSSGDQLTVTGSGETLEAHKTTCVICDIAAGCLQRVFLIGEVVVHLLEED
ncbi:MAG TPA: hypothetical protein VMW16_14490 [Sedimentisphaerales bacterium]|nr:hypothetical protein [Sedimentisphaerales bacterium]